jgi:hypothetical protein
MNAASTGGIGHSGWAAVVCFIFALAMGVAGWADEKVRKSPLAGSWYPADKVELEKQLNGFLKEGGDSSVDGEVFALISPHAGYRFCGRTAARGYGLVNGKEFSRVIILAVNHQPYALRDICVSSYDAYQTPLGNVPVDRVVCDELAKNALFRTVARIEENEHSAEMQIPFLQVTAKNLKIVPLIVGMLSADDRKLAAEAIRKVVDEKTLVVASSDFTHYGPRFGFEPFGSGKDLKERIKELDNGAIQEILKGNAGGFRAYIEKTSATICGHKPIELLLEIFPGAATKLLHYSSSAELPGGDYSNSVAYASLALYRPAKGSVGEGRKDGGLADSEKKTLLKIARDTLELFLEKKTRPDGTGYVLTPPLKEFRGAFVTLKNRGELRGCIGYMEGIKPLWETIVDNAVNASQDSRFYHNPVTFKEAKDITIEISVLSPRKKIEKADDIIIGTHGVEIEKRGHRAVYLPQVAPEQGWGRMTMLEHLCMKAGLRKDDWKEGATFLVFTAEVFSEEEKR